MITVRNLEKHYGGAPVLRDLSFSIEKGEIFGIVGHSGAGKSTLLRCFNGLERYQGGSVTVMDKEVSGLSEEELKRLRRDMGMIFQNFGLMGRKNVFENVAFPLHIWETPTAGAGEFLARLRFWRGPSREITDRVMEFLELVGLADKRFERVQNLSGGQKQRVGIARALALYPKILLCDEATSALDPNTTMDILDLLQDINSRMKLTMVVVTHQMEVVKRICHRLLLLDKGVAQCLGKTEELFISPPEGLKKFVEDEYTLIPTGTNIRMIFPREISQNAVITTMARDLDISFSIVGGKLERYLDDVLGFLIINVPDEHLEAVLNYMRGKNLHWEVLGNGRNAV
ncbi:Methionine import ATP-binding protein MetN [uncultured delta proteobacterium]|uniref:Methionine import ATP-binding protein MetN n=1 Tax=uncultured delta proteobacterium TaxID=34034 RepID=A0A212J7L4_9DELT|nr:Methionine import ATP-binding protein MetN [uncultured delta proteobacterium]